ncbi:MAG: FHA domain-containing protein [Clostridiaceae bacterium]
MSLASLKYVFTIGLLAIIYFIIAYTLKLIYSDVKDGGKERLPDKPLGLEVIKSFREGKLKKGSIVPIYKETTIGRGKDNTVVIDDPFVSTKHARIFLKNNSYYLEDRGSTNGTILNGEQLSGITKLYKEDRIEIGKMIFKIVG